MTSRERISSENVQITTDGFGAYETAIEKLFPRADHGSEVKVYGRIPYEGADTKYSPMVVTETIRTAVWGRPDPDYITTAHVERNNLTMRMHNRRFTRLTNAFSKKAQNHARALALHFMYYNYVRKPFERQDDACDRGRRHRSRLDRARPGEPARRSAG